MGVPSVAGVTRQAVFLDRDGVLNRAIVRDGKPFPPSSLEELEILPDVPDALRDLKAASFLLIGVTNQPDVGRGVRRREVVEAINAALVAALPLEEILVCYHDDADGCDCRKPSPGLLTQAAARHAIDLSRSFIVGDRWKDIEAGHRAGCATVLIEREYQEIWLCGPPEHRAHSMREAAGWILGRVSAFDKGVRQDEPCGCAES